MNLWISCRNPIIESQQRNNNFPTDRSKTYLKDKDIVEFWVFFFLKKNLIKKCVWEITKYVLNY